MKKIVLLSLVISFLASMVWAQEKVEAPVWNVGDSWTYENSSGGKWKVTVQKVEETQYEIMSYKTIQIYDKATLNRKDQNVRGIMFPKMLNFPISVGKKWRDNASWIGDQTGLKREGLVEYAVEGQENVTTRAGTFGSFRILTKITLASAGRTSSYWQKVWYSPDVKFLIKREYQKDQFWGNLENSILFDYKLVGNMK